MCVRRFLPATHQTMSTLGRSRASGWPTWLLLLPTSVFVRELSALQEARNVLFEIIQAGTLGVRKRLQQDLRQLFGEIKV